jgi:hypothetical protein
VIRRRDAERIVVESQPVAVVCDVCGREQAPRAGGGRMAVPGRFELWERNTPERVLDGHAMFNEWVLTGEADLCPEHAGAVADFVRRLAFEGGGEGLRAPRRED